MNKEYFFWVNDTHGDFVVLQNGVPAKPNTSTVTLRNPNLKFEGQILIKSKKS